MDRKELEIIQSLMEKLQEQMEMSEDDFGERLGRKKPEIEAIKIESISDIESDEEDVSESPIEEDIEESSPDDSLKSRLMKLRGE